MFIPPVDCFYWRRSKGGGSTVVRFLYRFVVSGLVPYGTTTVIKEQDITYILCGNLDIMRPTACLVVSPITVDNHALPLIARRRFWPRIQWRPLHKGFTSGLELFPMFLDWLFAVQLVGFLTLAGSVCRINQEYSSLFHHTDWFDLCVFTMTHRLS